MSNKGKKIFYDGIQDSFGKALLEMGELMLRLKASGELELEEVGEVLEHIASNLEQMSDLGSKDREILMRDWIKKYLKEDPEAMFKIFRSRGINFGRNFTRNRPFTPPQVNSDPYNHT